MLRAQPGEKAQATGFALSIDMSVLVNKSTGQASTRRATASAGGQGARLHAPLGMTAMLGPLSLSFANSQRAPPPPPPTPPHPHTPKLPPLPVVSCSRAVAGEARAQPFIVMVIRWVKLKGLGRLAQWGG